MLLTLDISWNTLIGNLKKKPSSPISIMSWKILFKNFFSINLGLWWFCCRHKAILIGKYSHLCSLLLPICQCLTAVRKLSCLFFVLNEQILYWTDDSKESMIGKVRVSGNVTTKNITGLKANTVYFASVRAYNTAGTGPSSPPVNVTTKKSRKYTLTLQEPRFTYN